MNEEYTKRLEETNKELEKSLSEALDAKRRLKKTLEVALCQILNILEEVHEKKQSLSLGEIEANIKSDFAFHKTRMIVADINPNNKDFKEIREYVENVENGKLHGET